MKRADERVLVLALLPILALVGVAVLAREWVPRAGPLVTVHRTLHCHCCVRWVRHPERSGFKVETHITDSLADVRARFGVAPALASCHTAVIDGLVIEGHVPAEDLRLALERRDASGLAVPGMPAGSPGMEGARMTPYDVAAWTSHGRQWRYAHHAVEVPDAR